MELAAAALECGEVNRLLLVEGHTLVFGFQPLILCSRLLELRHQLWLTFLKIKEL